MRRIVMLGALVVVAAACGLKVEPPPQLGGPLTAGQPGPGEADASGGQAGGGGAAVAGGGTGGGPAVGAQTGSVAQQARRAVQAQGGAGGGLFASDTEGITPTSIRLCVHVPITGAAPIDRDPGRFGKFYFDYVNQELGGIYGRRVEYIVYDDQYNTAGAVQAAERCKSRGAFVIAGAAGTDQLVAVAKWARDNRLPYLMGSASIRDVASYVPYAKMVGPDYEYQHELLADFLVKKFGTNVNYGMIRINSKFFESAHDAFVNRLRQHGVTLKVDEVVQRDENTFTQLITKLKDNNVKVVNNFTTPTIWIKLLTQKQQIAPDYNPTWTAVSPAAGYNLIAEALTAQQGSAPATSPENTCTTPSSPCTAIVFHHFNPAYPPTKLDDNATIIDACCREYADEIRKFQQIFAKYAVEGKTPRDDIDWSAYLAAKAIHRFLLKAGRDLTRSKLWAILDGYKETPQEAAPGCPADFTRRPNQGAWYVNVLKLGTRQWLNVQLCMDHV